jgi:O-antigen ligase
LLINSDLKQKYVIGCLFIASAILGGGSAPGLWTDNFLQLIVVGFSTFVLASSNGAPIERKVICFVVLIFFSIIVQLIPLPSALISFFRDDIFLSGRIEASKYSIEFISIGIGRTIEILFYITTLLFMFLALLKQPLDRLHALIPFFLLGVMCNAVVAIIQYSTDSLITSYRLLPFDVMSGFFANRNHFSSLLYTAIPFFVYMSSYSKLRVWAILGLLVALLVLLAAGSRAGALLGFSALLLSFLFIRTRTKNQAIVALIIICILFTYIIGIFSLLDTRNLIDVTRAQYAITTFKGILNNGFLGIGYGNFVSAYPVYEPTQMVFRSYVNHAHNDFLEIFLEGGLSAVILIALYICMLFSRIFVIINNHFAKAAFLGVIFIVLHSLVDYPMRTVAVSMIFVYFNAILFHHDLKSKDDDFVKKNNAQVIKRKRRIRT